MPTTTTILVKKKLTVGGVLLFVLLMSWRFFLGRPMNGKRTDNSSFFHGASRGKPGKPLTAWQKKPHIHRALIRGAVFWPSVFVLYLATINRTAALLICAFMLFPVGWMAFRKGRLIFFQPFGSTDATTGIRTQHWMLRNKWRRVLRRQPIPGLITRKQKFDSQLPEEMREAIAASLNTNELRGMPPVFRDKVMRYRRKTVRNDR